MLPLLLVTLAVAPLVTVTAQAPLFYDDFTHCTNDAGIRRVLGRLAGVGAPLPRQPHKLR